MSSTTPAAIPNPMSAPAALLDLVSRFREQLPDCKRGQYNETQLRRDFLGPLFLMPNWDNESCMKPLHQP